jgi:DNA-binding MarR family transcriptional regulator
MNKNYIDQVRAFNRFYTDVTGLLDQYILHSSYSLPEARVLFELYHHESMTASDIIALFTIDKGYLSRVLLQFEKNKLILKKRSVADARATRISLTAKGRKEFERLNQASHDQIQNLLEKLSVKERNDLVIHMAAIKEILGRSMSTEPSPQ